MCKRLQRDWKECLKRYNRIWSHLRSKDKILTDSWKLHFHRFFSCNFWYFLSSKCFRQQPSRARNVRHPFSIFLSVSFSTTLFVLKNLRALCPMRTPHSKPIKVIDLAYKNSKINNLVGECQFDNAWAWWTPKLFSRIRTPKVKRVHMYQPSLRYMVRKPSRVQLGVLT